jgi:hypothetical protein
MKKLTTLSNGAQIDEAFLRAKLVDPNALLKSACDDLRKADAPIPTNLHDAANALAYVQRDGVGNAWLHLHLALHELRATGQSVPDGIFGAFEYLARAFGSDQPEAMVRSLRQAHLN